MGRFSPNEKLDLIEKEAIEDRILFFRGNKTHTAISLGIAVNTLDSKLKQYASQREEIEKNERDQIERDRVARLRERGLTPEGEALGGEAAIKPVAHVHKVETSIPLESFEKAPQEQSVSMRQREKVQSVLPERIANGSSGKRR